MPELPEVETIKLELNKVLRNKKIKAVVLNLPKQVHGDRKKFLKVVVGAKIKAVGRRAKTLIITLKNKKYLIFHLKMTGQLIYQGNRGDQGDQGDQGGKLYGGGHPIKQDLKNLPNKFSHVIFNFSDGSHLFFNDTRQFGWVKLVEEKELANMSAEYGPEPLEKNFTPEYFSDFLARRATAIKPLLMEQKFIAGLGNIYAAEACFCAGISPKRSANKIKPKEIKKLYNCIKKILKLAIAKKGTSADNYVDAFGRQGNMINYLKVYGRKGKKCFRCGALLHEIRQGSRATVFCGKCQK
ncbi:MAG: bifunctional DNA-formamidopyrimidine glycosylase/DNA-(apurinic or apyrimidinic site) lyase [Patescibacteria group bacterium]|nr:bifunctional DNA-formamidopyrimidine glycosylase/DNA-(apurinic or apyrimidinic site) lyase [Patescibacteria group bacterium]